MRVKYDMKFTRNYFDTHSARKVKTSNVDKISKTFRQSYILHRIS